MDLLVSRFNSKWEFIDRSKGLSRFYGGLSDCGSLDLCLLPLQILPHLQCRFEKEDVHYTKLVRRTWYSDILKLLADAPRSLMFHLDILFQGPVY